MKTKEAGLRRTKKMERQIQEAIGMYLIRGFRGRLGGLVTVGSVQMPADLKSARVAVSVLSLESPQESNLDSVLKELEERAFEIQAYLSQNLSLRFCPKLTFVPDLQSEKILKVEKILGEIKTQTNSKSKSED